ncbi:MAG: exodeoxyribonuclease VII large subunit, partial [Patescibacteria group bacterium]
MPERTGLFDNVSDAFTKSKPRVLSVTELTQDIKLLLENTFTQVWVEGEVSGVSRISTGTVFFTLKDPNAQLKCVIFFNVARDIKFQLKDGIKLVCLGRISVYDKQGAYQLYVDKLEPKGVGGIQLALEQLKERLAKEGLFDAAHKKPLPQLPSRIGIVTSASGAAIKDILKVLDKRFQDVHIIINSVRVQGEGAKEDIAQAVDEFNALNNVDVIIVTRGGGSIEDLWAFNEEIVARAIYKSRIPVISAVGHERDVTISDLVADLRAPTPSAAAEIILPTRLELKDKIGIFVEDLAD